MKYLLTVGLMLVFFSSYAQGGKEGEEVQAVIHKIFDLCEKEQDAKLAQFMVYRGADKERKWKDVCTGKELEQVQKIRKRIQKRILPYEYEFVQFISEKESEGVWYVWEMKVIKGDEAKKIYLAFLKIKGGYALGDID